MKQIWMAWGEGRKLCGGLWLKGDLAPGKD